MRILINDANILIDLIHLEMLQHFSKLNFELFSTDFVLNEINGEQREQIDNLTQSQILNVIETESADDYIGISSILANTNGLSFEDCSVWYYSKKMNGTLITGDGRLRKQATKQNIEVRGILFIFDQMVSQGIISAPYAAKKLIQLKQLNSRLPKKELDRRISEWDNHCT